MKTIVTMLLLTGLLSCKTSHFKGGVALTDAPGVQTDEPQPTESLLPVLSETAVLQEPKPETPTKVEAPIILTLNVTKLKHDALYKNCLVVTVADKSYPIACNKDFAAIPPKVITLPSSPSCHAIGIALESFQPVDQADCIKKIQANRQQHNCEYQKEAFRKARLPDPLRFKVTAVQAEGDMIRTLDVAFEDSQDADYNDYTFSIAAGAGGYLLNRDKGVEYCVR